MGTDALVDAVHIGALFNMIVRMADSLGFEVPPPEALAARAEWRLNNSYRLIDDPSMVQQPTREGRNGLNR